MSRSKRIVLAGLSLAFLLGLPAAAQPRDESDLARKQLEYTRANYTKYEYRIPMRDSVKLFTSVYVPKDRSRAYPIMMQRTPYSVGPYGIDNYRTVLGPSELFERDVKLIDVYPNDYPSNDPGQPRVPMAGYQQLVRGEPFRGKFRNSLEKSEPFTPGKVEKIEFAMPDIFHTFRTGHRIMIQIQSSWFPLTDRNPQVFVDIPKAKESDFQKALERVFRGGPEGSRIRLLVID